MFSLEAIIQLATLAVTAAIGVCVLYSIFQMRTAYTAQQEKFERVIAAVEQFSKLQPEVTSLVRSVESDARALQNIAMQIEAAVASVQNAIASSVSTAAGRQAAVAEDLRDHIDYQEERLAKTLDSISKTLDTVSRLAEEPKNSEWKSEIGDYVRLRREVFRRDPHIRFFVLKDWISTNALAILHRASRGWNRTNDLIANVPAHLEPEAEIIGGSVLIIGTRGHAEKLAIALRDLDPSSSMMEWFEPSVDDVASRPIPAVLVRSNGQLQLISKGSAHEILSRRIDV